MTVEVSAHAVLRSTLRSSTLRAARREFDRFSARELFLWELRSTNAWELLRKMCQRFPKEPATRFDLSESIRVVSSRRYEVGVPWVKSLGADVDWFCNWVLPTIPERWVLPSQPVTHELALELSIRTIWRLPPWVPDDVQEAWGYTRGYDKPEPHENHYFREVDSEYFRERCIATRGLSDPAKNSVLFNWQEDEPPPNILSGETRKAFLSRMEQTWRRRAAIVEQEQLSVQSSVRKPRLHAKWFLLCQVCCLPAEEMSDVFDVDETTIRKAVRSFGSLIGIPIRSRKTNRKALRPIRSHAK